MPMSTVASSTVKGVGLYGKKLLVEFHGETSQGHSKYAYDLGDEQKAQDTWSDMMQSTSKGGYVWDNLRGKEIGPAYGTGNPTPGGTYKSIEPYAPYTRNPVGFMGATDRADYESKAAEQQKFKMESTGPDGQVLGDKRYSYPEGRGFLSGQPSEFYTEPQMRGGEPSSSTVPTSPTAPMGPSNTMGPGSYDPYSLGGVNTAGQIPQGTIDRETPLIGGSENVSGQVPSKAAYSASFVWGSSKTPQGYDQRPIGMKSKTESLSTDNIPNATGTEYKGLGSGSQTSPDLPMNQSDQRKPSTAYSANFVYGPSGTPQGYNQRPKGMKTKTEATTGGQGYDDTMGGPLINEDRPDDSDDSNNDQPPPPSVRSPQSTPSPQQTMEIEKPQGTSVSAGGPNKTPNPPPTQQEPLPATSITPQQISGTPGGPKKPNKGDGPSGALPSFAPFPAPTTQNESPSPSISGGSPDAPKKPPKGPATSISSSPSTPNNEPIAKSTQSYMNPLAEEPKAEYGDGNEEPSIESSSEAKPRKRSQIPPINTQAREPTMKESKETKVKTQKEEPSMVGSFVKGLFQKSLQKSTIGKILTAGHDIYKASKRNIGIPLDMSEEIPSEAYLHPLLQEYDSINGIRKNLHIGSEKVNDLLTEEYHDCQRYNLAALATAMHTMNPFIYKIDDHYQIEYICPDSLKELEGVEVPFGLWHNLDQEDSSLLPESQIIGTYKVKMVDGQKDLSEIHYNDDWEEKAVAVIDRLKGTKYYQDLKVKDWLDHYVENVKKGIHGDISTGIVTDVKYNKEKKKWIQKNIKLKSVSAVPIGNCSKPYCSTKDLPPV